jgi:hypothetical protein
MGAPPIPLPLPMGEGEGGGEQDKDLLFPLPSIPSHRWRGEWWGEGSKLSLRARSPAPYGVQGEGRACTPKWSSIENPFRRVGVPARRRGNPVLRLLRRYRSSQ